MQKLINVFILDEQLSMIMRTFDTLDQLSCTRHVVADECESELGKGN